MQKEGYKKLVNYWQETAGHDFETMDARYPEQKMEFYKICTEEYTEKYIKEVKRLYKILCQRLEQKK